MLASAAFSFQIQLGGIRIYKDKKVTFEKLGTDAPPQIPHIEQALQRMTLIAWFWIICFSIFTFLPEVLAFMEYA